MEGVAVERRKIRLRMSLSNLMEFKKEVIVHGFARWRLARHDGKDCYCDVCGLRPRDYDCVLGHVLMNVREREED